MLYQLSYSLDFVLKHLGVRVNSQKLRASARLAPSSPNRQSPGLVVRLKGNLRAAPSLKFRLMASDTLLAKEARALPNPDFHVCSFFLEITLKGYGAIVN
jgi:hypothetical protein